MKIKKLLLIAATASLSLSAFADEKATGEYADFMTGQATNDHFFVRMDYNDATYDNTVSFINGTPQIVWFWLDDDEIYQNEKVQALEPQPYNAAGDLYNEITYNSFQMDFYVPQSLEFIVGEDEDGEEQSYIQGDRLPSSATVKWAKKDKTKEVDGITYDWYTIVMVNLNGYGSHYSAKNASKYKANGALHKDDAPLFGLWMQNKNQANPEGQIEDMILTRLEFGMYEVTHAQWEPNEGRFIYCTGGNNESYRFELYNRVQMFGSTSVAENLEAKQIKDVKYFNVAGMQSAEPFDGVNIVVTTYNDGTTSTNKVVR